MAGCDPYVIRKALADQIRTYIAHSIKIEVYAWPHRNPSQPSITVRGGSEYIAYVGTMGGNGVADMMLELHVETFAADDESEFVLISDLLSAGTGKTSSLFDAVHSDRTLGGAVDDAVVLTAVEPVEGDVEQPSSVVVPVQIILSKIGANV